MMIRIARERLWINDPCIIFPVLGNLILGEPKRWKTKVFSLSPALFQCAEIDVYKLSSTASVSTTGIKEIRKIRRQFIMFWAYGGGREKV